MISIIMNPTRLRIVQYLLLHSEGTTGQIKGELTDIPPASLYRHIKLLEEASFIKVIRENRIRGAVEKVYQLKENMGDTFAPPGKEEIAQMINHCLISLMGSFQQYLKKEDSDLARDQLFLTTSTLLLNDKEFIQFQEKLGEAFNACIYNKPENGRTVRRITFISSPVEETR